MENDLGSTGPPRWVEVLFIGLGKTGRKDI